MTRPTRPCSRATRRLSRFACPAPRRAVAGATKPLLAVLVVAALGLVLWMAKELLSDSEVGSAAAGAGSAGPASAVSPGDVGVDLLEPTVDEEGNPQAAPEKGVRSGGQSAGRRSEAGDPTTVWVEGHVILPDGTPLDEKVFVESREKGGLGEPRDRKEIDADGNFRVAFTADASVGWLRVLGRYVWYPGSLSIRPGKTPKEEIHLEPVLGGRVKGSIVLTEGGSLPSGEIEVRLEGRPDSGNHWQRVGQVDFEVRRQEGNTIALFTGNAVPPGLYNIECTPDGFLSKTVESFRIDAGKEEIVDLELVSAPTLVGVILDPDGEPIADAEVQARPRGDGQEIAREDREDKTDENGRFVLKGVYPGPIELEVEAEGFVDYEEEFEDAFAAAAAEHTLTLDYGNTIAGRVILADGEPAAGARVTAKAPEGVDMRSSFRDGSSESTETDAEGRFFLSALGEGPYELLSSMRDPEGEGHLVAREEDIEINSKDVVLTMGPGFSISGRVVDLEGKPIKRYALSVRPQGSFSFLRDPKSVGVVSQRVRDEEGKFSVKGLLPGSWALNVVAGGYGQMEETELKLPPQPAELMIQMYRLSTIKGVVIGPDGNPVAKADVSYRKVGGGFDLSSFGMKVTNRRGQFRFGGVSPGTIVISSSADGYAPAEDFELEVGREQNRDNIQLQLGLGAKIEGVVQRADGSPATDARVSWNNTERGEGDSTAVDGEGRFNVAGVPSGPIEIVARIEYKSPSGRSGGTRMVRVERILAEGDVWTPVLREETQALTPTEVLVLKNGDPWSGAEVSMSTQEEGPGWEVRGNTDARGIALLELPGTGTYSFELDVSGNDIRGTCEVDTTGELEFDLSIGEVKGQIIVPEGKSPFYIQVTLTPKNPEEGPFLLSTQTISVDEDGTFHGKNILAGTYTISAFGPTLNEQMLKSPDKDITITRAGTLDSTDLTLSETGDMGEFDMFGGGGPRRRR